MPTYYFVGFLIKHFNMIKLQEYDKKNEKLSIIADINVTLANAIRRSVLEIPIMAIDEIEIIKNDSALYDEIIAQRMGLIPIKTEKTIKESKFKLKEIGPKTVYSTDIKPDIGTSFKIPIVLLDKEQEIEISIDARLGKGIEHIKYSPGLIYYKHNIEQELLDFVYVDEEGKIRYEEEELELKKLDNKKREEIKKLKDSKEIILNIESWGQIPSKDIFMKSIEVLKENLEELNKAVK